MRTVVLDSYAIVAALRPEEEHYDACKNLLEKVKDGALIAVEPYSVLIETTAAIKRRTDSGELARRVKEDLKSISTIHFFELSERRANEAADIAIQTGVRGMDAIVVQLAKEMDATLVTLDAEISKKAKNIADIKQADEFV